MNLITAGHVRTHGFPDTKSFKTHFGITVLKAPSMCAEHATLMLESNPRSGRPHSKEAIQKMRNNRVGKGIGTAGQYVRTPEIREKISKAITYLMGAAPDYTRGWWVLSEKADQEVFVRSTYEERVLRVLDLHPCVEEVWVEPFVIPYMFEGRQRRYLPDLLILLEGNIKELWEVKGAHLMKDPKTIAKIQALNNYVSSHDMNGRLVTLKDIEGMEMQVGIRPWVGPGGPWVRLDDPNYRPG